MKLIAKLEKLIEGSDLEIITTIDGHIKLIGGEHVVDWWPDSKKKTAFIQGTQQGIKYATPAMVVAMAKGEHP